jgi:MinD-like ATPase involved in chromosome partitioning or flagellar assembly
VLAEFDRQRPSLQRLIAAGEPHGLADVIAGTAGFAEAIHRDRGSRLHIIPLGRDARAAAFDDHAEAVSRTLGALSDTYDFVVCDMGAVGEIGGDIVQRADVVLLVARGDETEPRTVDAYHLLKDRGAGTVSVILTPERPGMADAANDAGGLSQMA